jgi:2'-5' RNA ligase
MAQSVELTLDPAAETVLTQQWRRLAEAGLPSAQRAQPSVHHRPHITLYAGDRIEPAAEDQLPALVTGLDLAVRVGAVSVFGPYRHSYILVRQVVPSVALLDLQVGVARTCGASAAGQFGAGRWSPHVTLARRMTSAQVGEALDVLGGEELDAVIRDCRRWDGDRRTAWWLTTGSAPMTGSRLLG